MQNLFESRVKYDTIDQQSGKEKTVTECYLLDAVSHGEAESRMYKEMESIIRGEFVIKTVRKVNYTEIFENEDGDRWYKAKISFESIDEKNGKAKRVSNNIVVQASNVKDAFDKIYEGMGGMTVDFDINAIAESPILEFFPYFKSDEKVTDGKTEAYKD
ncbi:MAG: DUF4494 domain-containing protein [Carboxylicivirga sp.]|jgi:hypothetical protein|nr:DUF4494 domain-containing protein [Carboxylicivirga sp.]